MGKRLKRLKKDFLKALDTTRKELDKANKPLGRIAADTTKLFEVRPGKHNVSISNTSSNNSVDLLGKTSNSVDLLSPPRPRRKLININGNLYWDFR